MPRTVDDYRKIINRVRIAVGWSKDDLEAHMRDVYGVGYLFSVPMAHELARDLYHLYDFHQWRAKRDALKFAVEGAKHGS